MTHICHIRILTPERRPPDVAGRIDTLAGRLAAALRRLLWTALVKPRAGTVEAIKRRKEERARSGVRYVDDPRCSVIVQSFNQVRNVTALEARLRATSVDELIVCDDGSLDGSHEAWMRLLVNPNDFLLHSNDIHEIRAYNRAVRFARGEIVCLMQDDDRPPLDGRWLAGALDLFDRFPALGVLGGWCGFDEYFEVEYNAPWLPAGTNPIPYADPLTGRPMVFVENVNIGPYLLRKRIFEEVGGFDLRFSPPGEPGITFESEFCYRLWDLGHQVALTDIPVKQHAGDTSYILPGGTTMWGNDARVRNEATNKQLIREMYDDKVPHIRARVTEANALLTPL